MGERIQTGTKVTWHGGNRPYNERHTGTIMAFVAPNEDPYKLLPALNEAKRSHIQFDRWSQNPRYLVLVPRSGKSTISDYYAPMATWLEK